MDRTKGEIDNSILIDGHFNIRSITDRTTRQKINKEREDLDNTQKNHLDLKDICGTFHPTRAEDILLKGPREIL